MLIKMKESRLGSQNGYDVQRFEKGQVYDIGESLACDFVNKGFARKVDADGNDLTQGINGEGI